MDFNQPAATTSTAPTIHVPTVRNTTAPPAKKLAPAVQAFAEAIEVEPGETRLSLDFPVDVLPDVCRSIVADLQVARDWLPEYTGPFLLSAAAAAIGNAVKLEVCEGWEVAPSLWLCVIGRSGSGKTPAQKFFFNPLRKMDIDAMEAFEQVYDDWDNGERNGKKPTCPRRLIDDATIEQVAVMLKENPRGLCQSTSEILTWIMSFGQYKSGNGGDAQKWLKIHDHETITVDRKSGNGKPLLVKNPCASVVGGIQPGKLKALAEDGKMDDGFIFRMIFAYPPTAGFIAFNPKPYQPGTVQNWADIIARLDALPFDPALETIIPLDPPALDALKNYSLRLKKWADDEADDLSSSMAAKATDTAARLAVILETLNHVSTTTTNTAPPSVSERSMQGAAKLCEYFRACALLAIPRMKANPKPADLLDGAKRVWFEKLPDEFETAKVVEIALAVGLSEITAKRALKETSLFARTGHGKYSKN